MASPIFAFYLQRIIDLVDPNNVGSGSGLIGGGELTLGGLNTARYTGSITYAPVVQQVSEPNHFLSIVRRFASNRPCFFFFFPLPVKTYWEVQMDGVSVNGRLVSNTQTLAAIDTGTSLVYLPVSVANALYTALGARNQGNIGVSLPVASLFARPDFYLFIFFLLIVHRPVYSSRHDDDGFQVRWTGFPDRRERLDPRTCR